MATWRIFIAAFSVFYKGICGLVVEWADDLETANADRARICNAVFFFSSNKCKFCAYRQGSRRKGMTNSGRG